MGLQAPMVEHLDVYFRWELSVEEGQGAVSTDREQRPSHRLPDQRVAAEMALRRLLRGILPEEASLDVLQEVRMRLGDRAVWGAEDCSSAARTALDSLMQSREAGLCRSFPLACHARSSPLCAGS